MVLLGLIVTAGWSARGDLSTAEYLAVEALADAAGAAVFVVAAVTVMRNRRRRAVPIGIVVGVWFLIGLARAAVLSRFYLDGVAQVLSAAATLTAWALLIIYVFATFAEERERSQRLRAANEELRAVRDSTRALLDEERGRLVEAVRSSVAPEIARLRSLIGLLGQPSGTAEITALADRVSAYSSDVVRETSRRLRLDQGVPSVPTGRPADSAQVPTLAISYATASQPLVIPMGLIALRAVTVWLSQEDLPAALIGFLGIIVVTVAAVGFRIAIDRLLPRPSVAEFALTTGLIVAMAAAMTGVFRWARDGASGPEYVPLGMIFAFVLAVLAAARLVTGLEARWSWQTREWARVNAELESANEELRQEVYAVRDQLAGILHGPVQGRLAAASMALRMHVDAREAGEEADLAATLHTTTTLLDRVQWDIEHLGRPDVDRPQTLGEGCARIAANWRGLLEIDWVIDDRWPRSAEFVDRCLEVIGELVTNASRHADARRIRVSCEGVDEAQISITAIDDGSGPPAHVVEGQGLAQVRRQHGSWTIGRGPWGGAEVTVLLRADAVKTEGASWPPPVAHPGSR